MFIGCVSILMLVTLMGTKISGWVLTGWVTSGFWFAAFASMCPCLCLGKPTPVRVLVWAALVFCGFLIWFRAYLVECRVQWEDLFVNNNLNTTDSSVQVLPAELRDDLRHHRLPGSAELQDTVDREAKAVRDIAEAEAKLLQDVGTQHVRSDWTRNLNDENFRAYCYAHQHHEDAWPRFYPIGEPDEEVPRKFKHLLRGRCPPWTCEFSRRQKKLKWALLIAIIVATVLNAIWVVFACPVGRCCGACVEQINNCFGFGRCSLWWIWFWVWFSPMWATTYVTFVNGFNFNNVYMLGLQTFSVLVQDTERLMLIVVIVLCFVLLYLARDSIYKLLGIDDRNIIHYFNLRGFNKRTIGFQVCIWQVCGSQRDCDSKERVDNRQDILERERSLIRTVLSNPNADNLLPSQGKHCNLFVRLAFGDNEPQTSRIVRMTGIMRPDTEVPFRASFSLELRDDLESSSALHVEVRDQAVMGASELGRAVFKVGDIMDAIRFSEVKMQEMEQVNQDLKLVPNDGLNKTLGHWRGPNPLARNSKLNAAEEQVVRMMSRSFRNDPQRAKQELAKVGFKPYRLSAGGAVWLAFAQLNP
jgi:hypothetical protein